MPKALISELYGRRRLGAPAGSGPTPPRERSTAFENIFDTFSLPQVPFIDGRENLARINGTASLKKPPVECGRCNVPVDSPKVPKSTSIGALGTLSSC